MPKKYTVQPNDWLSKIARKHGFRDNGKAIWNANPMVFWKGKQLGRLQTVTGGNPDVLLTDWEFEIPDARPKDLDKGTTQTHKHVVPSKPKNLAICLRDSQGKPVKGKWNFRFEQEGKEMQKGETANGEILVTDIDENTPAATLTVYQDKVYGTWKSSQETITLDIGGLDPITEGKEGIAAIQKMLNNLGYYKGEPNGALDIDTDEGTATGAAIWGFKHDFMPEETSGIINAAFCAMLQEQQGSAAGCAHIPADNRDLDKDRFAPLPKAELSIAGEKIKDEKAKKEAKKGAKFEIQPKSPPAFVEYEEPMENEQTGLEKPLDEWGHTQIVKDNRLINPMQFFPSKAYVAPYTAGETKKFNNIQMTGRRFVFLDTGNFYSNHTTFGVIWGSHVYLCNYKGEDKPLSTKPISKRDRLDSRFFDALGGSANFEVLERTSAFWASPSDFDWNKLYLIIPDMHLMKGSVAKAWHKKPFGNPFSDYSFEVELKLLALAQTLQKSIDKFGELHAHVKVVQIGDSYDLWVGCEPRLFQTNETRQMLLEPNKELNNDDGEPQTPVQRIAAWVQEIRSSAPKGHDLNPAVQALDILKETFGPLDYIYGNHDNYLIRDDVCSAADLQQRLRWQKYEGIFIEHAHRLEAKFTDARSGTGARHFGKGAEDVGGVVGTAGAVVGVAGGAVAIVGEEKGNSTLSKVGKVVAITGAVVAGAGLVTDVVGEAADYVGYIKGARNYDGDPSGFDAANLLYKALDYTPQNTGIGSGVIWLGQHFKDVADEQARDHDQPQYIMEFARVWLGREATKKNKPPHIFVIGHTHIPNLLEIHIEPWVIEQDKQG